MSYILSFIFMVNFFIVNAHSIEVLISGDADIIVLMSDGENENDLTEQLDELITGDVFMHKYAYVLLITLFISQPIMCAEKAGATEGFFHMQHIANRQDTNGAPLSHEYSSFLRNMRQDDSFPTYVPSWSVGSVLGAAVVGVGGLVFSEVKAMIVYAARRRVQNAIIATAESVHVLAQAPPSSITVPNSSKNEEELDPMDVNEFLHDGQAREAQSAIEGLSLSQLHMLAASEEATNPTVTFFRDKYQERLSATK